MPTSVLNHILALSRNFCFTAIIAGWSFYLLWSHNADTNPFKCLTQKGTEKPIAGAFFFACFLRNAEACILKILLKITDIIFSSTGRTFSPVVTEGGVAPDCMDSALKTSFPWLQAPFCFRTVVLSHPEWGATRFYIEWIKRWTRTVPDSASLPSGIWHRPSLGAII